MRTKEENRVYARKWRAANPSYDRKWRSANPERARATCRKWRITNPERAKVATRKWRAANSKRIRAVARKWYAVNSERVKVAGRKWYAANLERCRANRRKWYAANSERVGIYTTKWNRAKYWSDEGFAVRVRLRALLRRAFNRYSTTGKLTTSKAYGIDFGAIVMHLGHCPGERNCYHIDHIRPLSSFDFDDLGQVKLAFAPENHQWLTAEENKIKGAKWEKESEKSIVAVSGVTIKEKKISQTISELG